MTSHLTPMALAVVGVALLLVLGKVALRPATRLQISVFRPYRGDPWPIGVQEDDDARFSWAPSPVPVDEDRLGIVEDRPTEAVELEPVRVSVRSKHG